MNIYLDNAATTKPDPQVIEAMDRVQKEAWGNPSSIHSVGQAAANVLAGSRQAVADFLGCGTDEVIFTSGGSESDNLAIRGLISAITNNQDTNTKKINNLTTRLLLEPERPRSRWPDGQVQQYNNSSLPHIITSAAEHHAVLHTVQELEKEGKIEATYLKPDGDGIISPDQVIDAIRENTVLVSLMYVNNETGVITPIKNIGEVLKTKNQKLKTIYFHTDAVQAAEWLPMNVDDLGVDLLTFTAHKIHGPKGIGVLYARKGTRINPEITGGGQEFRLRAGTENVAAIAGLAEAVNAVSRQSSVDSRRSESLRDKLVQGIVDTIPDSILNGSESMRSPHIANISFLNAEGEAIILNLDFLGIQVSSGSACTSRSLEPSHVLSSMGIPPEKAHGSIRFSLSRETTEAEIDKVLEVLPGIIKKLRDMSPFGEI